MTSRRKCSARVVRTGKGARRPSHARVVRGYAAITAITRSGVDAVETQSTRGYAIVGSKMVRSRGLEPPHSYGYMHLKHARPPIPPRPLKPTASDSISSNTYLKLVGMPVSTSRACSSLESRACGLLFHCGPGCLNVFVSRVVQTGLPEFGTL